MRDYNHHCYTAADCNELVYEVKKPFGKGVEIAAISLSSDASKLISVSQDGCYINFYSLRIQW